MNRRLLNRSLLAAGLLLAAFGASAADKTASGASSRAVSVMRCFM